MGSPLGNWGKFPQMCVRYSGALFGRNCPLGCTVEKLKTHHSAIRAIKAIILYFEIFSLIGEFGRNYITWWPGNVLNLNHSFMFIVKTLNVLKNKQKLLILRTLPPATVYFFSSQTFCLLWEAAIEKLLFVKSDREGQINVNCSIFGKVLSRGSFRIFAKIEQILW